MFVSEIGRIITYREEETRGICLTCNNLELSVEHRVVFALEDLRSAAFPESSLRLVADNPAERRKEYSGGCPFCAFVVLSSQFFLGKSSFNVTFEKKAGLWKLRSSQNSRTVLVFTPQCGYRPILPDAPRRSDFSRNAGSDNTWRFVKAQLSECVKNHPRCRRAAQAVLPRRLVKFDHDGIIKVVETQDLPSDTQYSTLSHCWGECQPVCTTTATLPMRMVSIEWSELTPVFQDALTVTRRLGLYFMWIDSLCIIQDDPEDWAREAGSMANIYESAFVTIAATVSEDGNKPFLTSRPWIEASQDQIVELGDSLPLDNVELMCQTADGSTKHLRARQTTDLNQEWFIFTQSTKSKVMEPGPLMQRAWAWQERLLARRYLSFGKWSTTFQCHTTGIHDNGVACPSLDPTWRKEPEIELTSNGIWHSLVRRYSGLNLTYEKDRLPALAGIASRVSNEPRDYLAGLWRPTLSFDLLWYSKNNEDNLKSLESVKYRVPSWSWASIPRNVSFLIPNNSLCRSRIEILEAVCQPAGGNTFGEVKHAHIILRGLVIDGTLKHYRRRGTDRYAIRHRNATIEFDLYVDSKLVIRRCEDDDADAYYCVGRALNDPACPEETSRFKTCKVSILLLASGSLKEGSTDEVEIALLLGHPSHDHLKYERLGIFTRRVHGGSSWFSQVHMKKLTLV